MVFKEISSEPFDRKFNCPVEEQGIENILTLGTFSYISHTRAEFDRSAEFGGYHPSHILIGKYSSLAGDMRLLMAFNHSYKGATSTFPFEDQPRIKKILAKAGRNFEPFEYPPNLRARENRYQLIIGHDVWIGYGCFFAGAVNIGNTKYYNVPNVHLTNIEVLDSRGNAFFIRAGNGKNVNGLELHNIRIDGAGGYGLYYSGATGEVHYCEIEISNCDKGEQTAHMPTYIIHECGEAIENPFAQEPGESETEYYDLLGRRVTRRNPNSLYIRVFKTPY